MKYVLCLLSILAIAGCSKEDSGLHQRLNRVVISEGDINSFAIYYDYHGAKLASSTFYTVFTNGNSKDSMIEFHNRYEYINKIFNSTNIITSINYLYGDTEDDITGKTEYEFQNNRITRVSRFNYVEGTYTPTGTDNIYNYENGKLLNYIETTIHGDVVEGVLQHESGQVKSLVRTYIDGSNTAYQDSFAFTYSNNRMMEEKIYVIQNAQVRFSGSNTYQYEDGQLIEIIGKPASTGSVLSQQYVYNEHGILIQKLPFRRRFHEKYFYEEGTGNSSFLHMLPDNVAYHAVRTDLPLPR